MYKNENPANTIDLPTIKHCEMLTGVPSELFATQLKHTLSVTSFTVRSCSIDIWVPLVSLPLNHFMLGAGFPTTGHVNVFEPPSPTVAFSPLPVASTGSLKEKKKQ